MCVKMLNPKEEETLIDTAAGSSGFTVHGIFKVWRDILRDLGLQASHLFTLEKKPQRCLDYVNDKVFTIDFDEISVRVARCLNLIAGDGQTNILHLNTLEWKRWDEQTADEGWIDTYNEGWKKLKRLRAKKGDNRRFQFEVLMANPLFFLTRPFDEARYRALMEGLEVSEHTAGYLRSNAVTFRFDSEYYEKRHILDEERVEKDASFYRSLTQLGLTINSSAFYPSIEDYYDTGDLPFIRVADVDSIIDFESCITIPPSLCSEFPTLKEVAPGDIVITKGGSIARVGVVTQAAAACRDIIFINTSKLRKADQDFLGVYFQTSFFNRMLRRSSSQTAQPHLTLTLVRDLPIFQPSSPFRARIGGLLDAAYSLHDVAMTTCTQAEDLLLSELGLKDWQPEEPLSYEATSSQTFAAGRLDAEHFKPMYNDLVGRLQDTRLPIGKLQDVVLPIRNGFDCRDFVEEGTPYIRVGDVSLGRINLESCNRVPVRPDQVSKDVGIMAGDVLFTRKGSFGNCAVATNECEDAIISSEIMRLRLCAKDLLPEYLALYLNSIAGKLQVLQRVHGVAFYGISQPGLAEVAVCKLPVHIQQKLADAVKQSHLASDESKALLEKAKRAVEIAIEQGEVEAGDYLAGKAYVQ